MWGKFLGQSIAFRNTRLMAEIHESDWHLSFWTMPPPFKAWCFKSSQEACIYDYSINVDLSTKANGIHCEITLMVIILRKCVRKHGVWIYPQPTVHCKCQVWISRYVGYSTKNNAIHWTWHLMNSGDFRSIQGNIRTTGVYFYYSIAQFCMFPFFYFVFYMMQCELLCFLWGNSHRINNFL